MGGAEEKRRRHLILPARVSIAGPKPDIAAAVNLATTLSVGEVPASGGTRPSPIATEEAFAMPEYLQAYLRLAAQSDALGLRYPTMQLSRPEVQERGGGGKPNRCARRRAGRCRRRGSCARSPEGPGSPREAAP